MASSGLGRGGCWKTLLRVDKVGAGRKAEWGEQGVLTSSLYLFLKLCSLFPCLLPITDSHFLSHLSSPTP